jgi:hypothetical protein
LSFATLPAKIITSKPAWLLMVRLPLDRENRQQRGGQGDSSLFRIHLTTPYLALFAPHKRR